MTLVKHHTDNKPFENTLSQTVMLLASLELLAHRFTMQLYCKNDICRWVGGHSFASHFLLIPMLKLQQWPRWSYNCNSGKERMSECSSLYYPRLCNYDWDIFWLSYYLLTSQLSSPAMILPVRATLFSQGSWQILMFWNQRPVRHGAVLQNTFWYIMAFCMLL